VRGRRVAGRARHARGRGPRRGRLPRRCPGLALGVPGDMVDDGGDGYDPSAVMPPRSAAMLCRAQTASR